MHYKIGIIRKKAQHERITLIRRNFSKSPGKILTQGVGVGVSHKDTLFQHINMSGYLLVD